MAGERDKSEADAPGGPVSAPRWVELALAILMAAAAVGTAWAGFQSAKWGGVQANSYAQASAVRIESNRASTLAGQRRIVDVVAFTSWLNALEQEIIAERVERPAGSYEPAEGELSGILFERFRDEFRPAVDAWLATRPLVEADAPATPFDMPEYANDAEDRAESLESEAEDLSATAREANQRSDDYVLTAVVFALVLFFAGVGSRARARRSLLLLSVLGGVALVAGVVLLATMPVEL